MNDFEIHQLVYELDKVDFREFWWDSKLLQICSKTKDSRIVKALLSRHHCLQNKQADSAHVIRNTIKLIEGPNFPTLWFLVDKENNTNNLIGTIDDPYSDTWAAAFVLGEVGGAQALSQASQRLTSSHSSRHFLIAKLAFHLIIRYVQIKSEGEPTITEVDIATGYQKETSARASNPEIYSRILLRRQQANEYFQPVSRITLISLKGRLARIPNNFFPIPKNELFSCIDQIPVTSDGQVNNLLPRKSTDLATGVRNMIQEQGRFFLHDLYRTLNEALPGKRRQIQDDIETLEEWASVKNGEWSKEQIERFTRQYESFISEWKPELIKGISHNEALDPVILGVLNRMFGRE